MKTADLILLQLKSLGPHSAKMLAEKLSMTTMGVRQHMQHLEEKELVCHEDVRTKVGRPTRFWSLTSDGHAQFPDRHNVLSSTLLESTIEIFGQDGLDKLIHSREDKLYTRYSATLDTCDTLEDKLQALVDFRQKDGYMAELIKTDDGLFLLVENHCPIGVAAQTCSTLCHSEIKLFHRLLGDKYSVERTEHIVSGSRHCAYVVTPRES